MPRWIGHLRTKTDADRHEFREKRGEKRPEHHAKTAAGTQYLAGKPNGAYVCGFADAILTSEWRREHNSGFSAQQATRSGAGYAIPLINAGLVRKQRTDYSWGMVFLTDAGHKVIAAHDAANNPANQPLDAVLARCVED